MEGIGSRRRISCRSISDPYSDVSAVEKQASVVVDPGATTVTWREVELLTNDGIAAVVNAGLEADEKIRSNPKDEV